MKFSSLFSVEHLNYLARYSGFLKRQRRLTPQSFINSLVFHAYNKKEVSLTDHIVDIGKHENIIMSKQSLHQRFNNEAVDFIKLLVEEQCRNKLSTPNLTQEMFSHWKNIYLHDSCQFGMPDYLSKYFQGYGGGINNNSIVKIQHCYELKSGRLHSHQVHDARTQDAINGKALMDTYQKGDLVLRDLGYFDLESFKDLNQDHHVDYISRLKPKTSIFQEDGQQIDMARLAKKMKKQHISYIDKWVRIGTKKPLRTRIIITLAPEKVKQERIRKANKQNKSYGNQTSEAYRLYAGFNIFITNIEQDVLSADQVMKLYRVRWQIELVFKTWKSYYKLNCIKSCNCHRTLCYLYANLLLILINLEICSFFQAIGYFIREKTLSVLKLMKSTMQYKDIQRTWTSHPKQIESEIYGMFANLVDKTVRESRKSRHNYDDIIGLIN